MGEGDLREGVLRYQLVQGEAGEARQADEDKRTEDRWSRCALFIVTASAVINFPTVLTPGQRAIFDKVKAFVLEYRKSISPHKLGEARLAMPNLFPAGERKFITDLTKDLHLDVTWDEYDDYDQNLVTIRFPGALDEPVPVGDDVEDEEWEDDEEAQQAVDRVLKKYEKAHVVNDADDGDFDTRHERAILEKMDEWKRGYYKARYGLCFNGGCR